MESCAGGPQWALAHFEKLDCELIVVRVFLLQIVVLPLFIFRRGTIFFQKHSIYIFKRQSRESARTGRYL